VDWKWTVTAVLPVASLVLGAWLNQLSESRREAAALSREEQLHQLDRAQARLDRREAFERTHLIEMNDLLSQLLAAAALRYHEHVQDDEPLGEAGKAPMGTNREMSRVMGAWSSTMIFALWSAGHTRSRTR
jgi:hypothetical protein